MIILTAIFLNIIMDFKEFTEQKKQIKRSWLAAKYPKINGSGDLVDGMQVTRNIDNISSISASLIHYEAMPGIRRLPISDFYDKPWTHRYSVPETQRVKDLAAQINKSKKISPLIVVIDKNKYPYVLEGGHRADALSFLGAKEFPAMVVVDTDEVELI